MKKLLTTILSLCLLLAANNSKAQTTNTFPPAGNAGVGTTNPNSTLQVAGTVTIDSSVVIHDSLSVDSGIVVGGKTRLKGDLIVTGDIRSKGKIMTKDKLVIDSIAILKDRLIVEGKARLMDDAAVFGNFLLKALEDFNAPNKRVIGINQEGKVMPMPPEALNDLIYAPTPCIPPYPRPKWNSGLNTLWVNCPPQTKVGIGTEFPLKKLHVVGDAFLAGDVGIGTANPGAQLGVRNISGENARNTQFFDSENRRLFIVPKLSGWAYSKLSQNGDVGIFYSDNPSGIGPNHNAGLVLAPFGGPDYNGIRIGADGNIVISGGNVGTVSIGTTNAPAGFRLAVCGKIKATEVEVAVSTGWCDYVFDEGYRLMPWEELQEYYTKEKHLPHIPSAKIIETTGLSLGEMQTKQMLTIEEMYLYMTQFKKELDKLTKENEVLEKRIVELEQQGTY